VYGVQMGVGVGCEKSVEMGIGCSLDLSVTIPYSNSTEVINSVLNRHVQFKYNKQLA